MINQRKKSSEGRKSDFINLMLKSEITESEKSSATRSRLQFFLDELHFSGFKHTTFEVT